MTQHTKLWEPGAFVAAMEVADVCELTIPVPKMNEFQSRLLDKGYAIQKKKEDGGFFTPIRILEAGFALGALVFGLMFWLAWVNK